MKPILLALHLPLLGEVTFPAYFTLLTLGFALALWMTWRESRHLGLDPDRIIDLNLWMVVWGLVGARALSVLADGHLQEYIDLCRDPTKVRAVDALVARCTADAQCGYDYLCDLATHTCHPPRDCFAVFEAWRGGLAYYGGFLFAVAFAVWFLRRHRMPFLRVADLAAPAIALGLFFGRLGCFFNGCCFGKETASALGLVFPRGGLAWRAQLDAGHITAAQAAHAVHPTQLYEAAACLGISALLYYVVRPHKRRDGDVLAGLLLLYGVARFALEYLRDDDRGVFFGGWLSTSQLISVPLVLGALALLGWTRRSQLDQR